MIVDYLLELARKQGLTAAAGSTNAADFEQDEPTTGLDGQEVVMIFQVAENVTGNLQFCIQDAGTNEEASYSTVVAGPTFTNPVAGTQWVVKLPYTHKRFMRAYFGGTPTAGKVNALITSGFTQNEPFKVAESYKESRPDVPAALGADPTYITKASADAAYLGKTEKAASAKVADSANGLGSTVKVNLGTQVSGTLGTANGGTGSTAGKAPTAGTADSAKGLAAGTKVDLTSQVRGVLPVANGGTGKATA